MKVNMNKDKDTLLNWFIVCGVSTDKEQFNKLVESEGFDSEAVDLKIVVNGFEFTNIEDLFERMEKHIDEQVEKRYKYDEEIAGKLEKIQSVINGNYDEED